MRASKLAILSALFLFLISAEGREVCGIEIPAVVAGGEGTYLVVPFHGDGKVTVNGVNYILKGNGTITIPFSEEFTIVCESGSVSVKPAVIRAGSPGCDMLRALLKDEIGKIREGWGSREVAGLILMDIQNRCERPDLRWIAVIPVAAGLILEWRRRK